MAYQQYNPLIEGQLAHNNAMRRLHAESQARVDVMRLNAVARSAAAVAAVQQAGAARNVLGGLLPMETRPKVRRQMAQHVGGFTLAKSIRADQKARQR